jgi:hypothetical protein
VPHHGRARVARRVEAVDDRAILAQHARSLVGLQAALGAKVTRNDLDRVVRRLGQRREVRIRPAARVPVVPVIRRVAAAKVLVLARPGVAVEPPDGLGEPVRRDPTWSASSASVRGKRSSRAPPPGQRLARRQARRRRSCSCTAGR